MVHALISVHLGVPVSLSRRPVRLSFVLAVVVAASLLVGIAPAAIAPARAAEPLSASRAADAKAAGGRLIVFWKSSHKPNLSLPLVASVRGSSVGAHRSVVTAAPGEAAAVAARLRADPDVAAVVPDVVVHAFDWPATGEPNDPHYTGGDQDNLSVISMPTAWHTTTGASSVIVAVLDTGTTVGHEDLVGTSFVAPYNVITNSAGAVDGEGHGTHVSGTIAARTNNGVGVAGVAPGVSIMPVKMLDDQGSGAFSDLIEAIDYARIHGADVISMSLGAPAGAFTPSTLAALQTVITQAYAAGITIVAAAGNNGDATVSYPCAFVHVICVGATYNSDAHAEFSNTNAYVDISAPGVNILSTGRTGGYQFMSGTSMATPHVAALAALIRSVRPTETVDQVETTILSTAKDLGAPGRDDLFGAGRINAAAAVNLSPPDLFAPVMTGLTSTALVRTVDRSFTARWTATDNVGIVRYEVRTKRGASGKWSTISSQTGVSRAFAGFGAGSWYIAVRAVDAAARKSAWRQVVTVVPRDDRAWAFTSGTTRPTGASFIEGTETRTSRTGAKMTIHFSGTAFYLLGTSAVARGKLRVTIDGHSWTVDEGKYLGVRATTTTYRALIFSKSLVNKKHIVVITCLGTSGRPVIDVDAIGWRN
jgi:subtilisin family serine protease